MQHFRWFGGDNTCYYIVFSKPEGTSGHIDQTHNNIWTTITVVAIPMAAAVALGLVVKYGLLLKLK